MVNAQVYDNKTTLSGIKDKRLISILQTDASKDIDENVEPREVYQGKLPDMIESNQAVNRQGFIPTVDISGPSYTLSDAKIPNFLAFANIAENTIRENL